MLHSPGADPLMPVAQKQGLLLRNKGASSSALSSRFFVIAFLVSALSGIFRSIFPLPFLIRSTRHHGRFS